MMNIDELIQNLRQRIEDSHYESEEDYPIDLRFKFIDDFIGDTNKSALERAFFLILNQFPFDDKHYIVVPNERVLLRDVYDMSSPGVENEVDFALYGGSIDNPVKVAIECDGIRSHGMRRAKRDRRKEVNLQAAGWIVIRFRSKEIREELENFENDENYTSDFLISIENTIQEKLKLITRHTYATNFEYRSKLTGYKWDYVTCTNCGYKQRGIVNYKKLTCAKCNEKFTREIKSDEKIEYDHDGLLYFKD